MIRRSITLVGAALAAFHVWLFAGQVLSGAIGDPSLILRWLVAAGLIGGLVYLRRSGESLIGRRAIAIWVLAALLHGPALATRLDTPGAPAVPEVVITLTVGLSTVLLGGLGLLATRRFRVALTSAGTIELLTIARPTARVSYRPFSPRPPPRLA
ncbi:MAG: hypothetical protein AMXMBFR57_16160 [Acidimicrobiia bacterium]